VPDELRVGLVAYADAPGTVVRPTEVHDGVRAALARLSATGGTAARPPPPRTRMRSMPSTSGSAHRSRRARSSGRSARASPPPACRCSARRCAGAGACR